MKDDGQPSRFERTIDRIPFVEKELLLLRELVGPGDRCVDVGAAGGAHLLVMASQVGEGGRVLGVEPRPGSYRMLRRIVRASGLSPRVTLAQVALADRDGTIAMRVPVVPTRAHFRGSSPEQEEQAAFAGLPARDVMVRTRRLDDVVAEAGFDRVDVLKCDVEGAELLVFSGANRVLTRLRPTVLVEADDLHQRRFDATAQDVIDVVAGYGYHSFRFRRGRLEPAPRAVATEDDYVLLPVERAPAVLSRLADQTAARDVPQAA